VCVCVCVYGAGVWWLLSRQVAKKIESTAAADNWNWNYRMTEDSSSNRQNKKMQFFLFIIFSFIYFFMCVCGCVVFSFASFWKNPAPTFLSFLTLAVKHEIARKNTSLIADGGVSRSSRALLLSAKFLLKTTVSSKIFHKYYCSV